MEETLTDCLNNIRDDLSQLKRVREYLDSDNQFQGSCIVTWRTMEAFNTILTLCTSQDTPEIEALNTILDSFYHIASHNNEESVWANFGFELGVICVKILTAIERTDKFEGLFCKLLTVINSICEHNSDVWKPVARPILNVFINKRFSFEYLETVLKIYVTVLRGVESFVLHNFAVQNLGHLKTFSTLIETLGDFETQMDIMELVFLHISEKKLLHGFFSNSKPRVSDLFQTLHFVDFESDCRIFLNALNKEAADRKIYSICCNILSLGGCYVDPPAEGKHVWLDANKDSERLSLKYSDFQSTTITPKMIFIQFSSLLGVRVEKQTSSPGSFCVTIKTKNLTKVQEGIKNSDILCIALESDNGPKAVAEFVDFLRDVLEKKKRKKFSGKLSRTQEEIFLERLSGKEATLQDNAISSSVFDKNKTTTNSQSSWNFENIPGDKNFVRETQEPTPSSFVESLSKNLGISPEVRHSFEDSIQTVTFLPSSGKKSHTLFRSLGEFHFIESDPVSDLLFENKENEPPKLKTPPKAKLKPNPKWPTIKSTRILRSKKKEQKLFNPESQDYFRKPNPEKEKPMMPKLKKSISTKKKKPLKKLSKSIPEKPEVSRPSLLDPNGYAYKRWIKPTTSERSNFWLRKLVTVQTNKAKSNHVFDFSEESESEKLWKGDKRVKKAAKTKKKLTPPLKEIKEILKTSPCSISPKNKIVPGKSPVRIPPKNKAPPEKSFLKSPDKERNVSIIPRNKTFRKSPVVSSPQNKTPPRKNPVRIPLQTPTPKSPINEENIPLMATPPDLFDTPICNENIKSRRNFSRNKITQKRLRSDEENSLTKTIIKKKSKPLKQLSITFPLTLQRRIQKVEQKARHQTEEIVQTVSKATDHLIDHLWKKQAEKIVSYLNSAEEVGVKLRENEDLKIGAKRISKVVTYFEAGCTVSKLCEAVEDELSRMNEAWITLMDKRVDVSKKIDQINSRLKDVIETEIDRSIENELKERKLQVGGIVNFRLG